MTKNQFTPHFSVENIPSKVMATKEINLSYLDEILGDDKKMKMVELFIQNVPNDVDLLENVIIEKKVVAIKKMAHHMKSSLATFNLNEEVALLEQTEKDANDLIMSNKIMEEFAFFKSKIVETIMALKEIKIVGLWD